MMQYIHYWECVMMYQNTDCSTACWLVAYSGSLWRSPSMGAGDRSRFYAVLMPSHFSCVFWFRPSGFLQHLWGIEFVLRLLCFFPRMISLSAPSLCCHFEFRSRRETQLWFWLACLDVVSEVLCFLTCWPRCDPAVSMATAPAVRGCGSTGLCGCIPALTCLHT